jgi:uncharacterized protein (DUF433 family)
MPIMSQTTVERIVSKTDVCGGRPCIAGTRIRVQDIYVWHELQGHSADEIVSDFPQITMSDVYAALSYYWNHRDEMQRQMQEEDVFIQEMKAKHPSPLKEKLAAKHAKDHQVPS